MTPQSSTQPNISQGQAQHPPMTHDRAKAAMGNATLLQSFLLPSHNSPKTQPNAQEQQETPEPNDSPKEEKKEPIEAKMTELELNLTKQIDSLRKEMTDNQKMQMESIKADIQQALNDENGQEGQATTTA